MWTTGARLSVMVLGAVGALAALVAHASGLASGSGWGPLLVQPSSLPLAPPHVSLSLPADEDLAADATDSAPSIERAVTAKSASGLPKYIEVKTSDGAWQGLDFGRVSNLLLLLGRDGQLQRIELGRGVHVRPLESRFEPIGHRELEKDLRQEFGSNFKTIRTAHYVICHNTDDHYARETGELVEQLYRSFTAYFGGRGMGFAKPQFPMVVLIFDDESTFRKYLASSPGSSGMIRVSGIYSVETNRIAMFNAAGKDSKKYGNSRWHNLSTVIHEATHQIAFNSGCHRRYADNPVWLAEGVAMYFETPNHEGSKIVWNSAGTLNTPRLKHFATFRKKGRRADSIKTLVATDERFHSESTASDAYAESYALTYFLVQQRMPQFLKYVRLMAAKPSLEQDTPDQRLEDFQQAFGQNLHLLETSFLRYVDDLAGQSN